MANELTVRAPRGVARTFDTATLTAEWQADMLTRVAAGELARFTADTYSRGMARFLAWAGTQDIERVGPGVIRKWKADMLADGHKPTGVNTHLQGVKAFFRWAVSERGLAYDPAASVKGASRRQSKKHKRDALSDGEMVRVLAQPDPSTDLGRRDRALLLAMAYTGIRTIEVHRATVGDLQTNGRLKLYVHGKGATEADECVYLVKADLVQAMYDWLAVHPRGDDPKAPLFCGLGHRNTGRPLALRTLRAIVKAYYRAAGVRDPRKTTHSLRHSLVTNLIRHGVPAVKIMTVTRHKSLDVLIHYAHEVERDTDPAEAYVSYDGAG